MDLAAITLASNESARIAHGLDLVTRALTATGTTVRRDPELAPRSSDTLRMLVGVRSADSPIGTLEEQDVLLYNTGAPGEGGFYLAHLPGGLVVVTGGDDAGVLYGCQELARVITRTGGVPRDLDRGETPDMTLRGPAIGLQKTEVEPPRQVYEYPITPDRFEWFYDREHWLTVLDELFEHRANVIYLWSGHPFSSFVALPDYPEAQEVTDDELALNAATLSWLTEEADRRGIWIVVKFYNIHIPLPFAEHHGIPLRQPRPTPLTSRYTRAAIGAFVARYPNIGLYTCLGEVLQGDLYGQEWLLETIIPGVLDGVDAAGLAELPPLILRGHAIDPHPVVTAAREVYPRLYTEAKYNGESLTTWNPRGEWQEQHRFLASLGSTHIANVHILANLEPFRFGAVGFIQRSAQAMKHRLNAQGLHLYPLFYWDWPWSPDRAEPRLRQIERDAIWFHAWLRYAWRADRDPSAEQTYWTAVLAEQYGSEEAGAAALATYEAMGQIAPLLVRRVGITEGNRQTLSLGMTLSQLLEPEAHRTWPDLWQSHAPGGERLQEYVERELRGEAHLGETPIDVAADVRHFAALATRAADSGRPHVRLAAGEFARLRQDAHALALLAEFYALRIEAGALILRARSQAFRGERTDIAELEHAAELIEASVAHYRDLADLTDATYLYANSMRTPQRRVPFRDGRAYGHWRECLPEFEEESAALTAAVRSVAERGWPLPGSGPGADVVPFRAAPVQVRPGTAFDLDVGQSVFSDRSMLIERVAPELAGTRAFRMPVERSANGPADLELDLPADAHLLVGYVKSPDPQWLQVPDLEVNTHADDQGGLDPVLRSAIEVSIPAARSDEAQRLLIDVHAFAFTAGRHMFTPGPGAYLVLGAVVADQEFTRRDAADASVGPPDLLQHLLAARSAEEVTA
ncbi:hypothetical protein OCAE111667_02845 [Occultella aeris]|uniref:hypothetical protein n=1 Tax=Occultella aeris TaxID=2761496 RepID=UPI0012EA1E24|nr:hypothetical protein [Occultella aeris]